jgi:hypothetical protein
MSCKKWESQLAVRKIQEESCRGKSSGQWEKVSLSPVPGSPFRQHGTTLMQDLALCNRPRKLRHNNHAQKMTRQLNGGETTCGGAYSQSPQDKKWGNAPQHQGSKAAAPQFSNVWRNSSNVFRHMCLVLGFRSSLVSNSPFQFQGSSWSNMYFQPKTKLKAAISHIS